MADIENMTPEEFRRELATLDESAMLAQQIMHSGAMHALRTLLHFGVTKERVEKMLEQIEDNAGVVEQLAAERGWHVPINLVIKPG